MTLALNVSAQPPDWNTAGNFINGVEWFGADNLSIVPLQIRHDASDQPIDFYTAQLFRARINPTRTFSLNGFTNAPAHGFTLISPDNTFLSGLAGSPYSRLHLAEGVTGNASPHGYRLWQRNGITFTGNDDHGYVGHKYGSQDVSDMVIQWSDNPGFVRADRMRFIFTSEYLVGTPTGMNSLEGLEGMRLWPKNDQEINVGIGDFNAISGEPLDRLDVGSGKVRIRQLPSDAVSNSDEVVMVDMATGLLEHRPATDLPGTCEWTLPGGAGTNSNVATAYPGNPGCPQGDRAVGIGIWNPLYKLDVKHSAADANFSGGLKVNYLGNSAGITYGINTVVQPLAGSSMGIVTGIRSSVTGVENIGTAISGEVTAQAIGGASTEIVGVTGLANCPTSGTLTKASGTRGAVATVAGGTMTNAWGLHGLVNGAGTIGSGYGLHAESNGANGNIANSYGVNSKGVNGTAFNYAYKGVAIGGDGTTNYGALVSATGPAGSINYGVYAIAPTNTTSWAGYFQGHVRIQGNLHVTGTITTSDESLKTDVQEITDPMEIIRQLRPTTYQFLTDQNPYLNLPTGLQRGFIAQEVENVLPDVVHDVHITPVLDIETNEVLAEERVIKGINYTSIIPVVVAAMQEQDTRIAEQDAQLADAQATNDALNDQLQQVMDRLDAMEQSVSNCCADRGALQNGGVEIDEKSLNSNDRYLRIAPNPFETQTTVYYQLEQGGRMQLMVNSANGKELRQLHEANLEQGNYQYEWNTGDLAPGVYYVTLLMDGKPVTERAVKIN